MRGAQDMARRLDGPRVEFVGYDSGFGELEACATVVTTVIF
jgi:hypothetical protein